jgi:hypothetical protein
MEKSSQIKAAIIYLARSRKKDIADLARSLSHLDTNFNDRFKYPVIIFHEDFSQSLMESLRKNTHSNLQFEEIRFQIPGFLNKEDIPEFIYVDGFEFSIGYRHMCHFFSGVVYGHPSLGNYDYLWRLDTDSFIMDRIDYDIFQFMEDKKYIYGYIHIMKDEPDAVKGLWETTKKYIKDNNIEPSFLKKFQQNGEWDRSYFYTNFEISKKHFWLSNEFMNYFNYLDKSGGIYKYRWGDAVIHLLAISMFLQENQIHKFSDIAYQHQGFINNYSLEKDRFTKLKNIKLTMMTPFVKLSNILKRKSDLYRKIIKLLRG